MSTASMASKIPVKTAVQSALEYIREFSDMLPNRSQVRLEETEFYDAENQWLITVSFDLDPLISERRAYKQFRIDAETAEVIAMKNVTGL